MHLLVLIFFLFSAQLRAEDTSQVILRSDYESTSDQLIRSGYLVQYRNHRRDILYPFPDEVEQAWDFGAHALHTRGATLTESYCGSRLGVLFGRKFSNSYQIDLSLGAHHLRPQTSVSGTTTYGDLWFGFMPKSWMGGALRINRDFVYQDMLLPGGVTHSVTATAIELRGLLLPAERLRVPFLLLQKSFSNAISKSEADLALMYGISPGEPWVWFGLGINQIRHSAVSTNFYSPTLFNSFGPRLDLSLSFLQNWSFATAVNLNRFFDQDSDSWGSGHYATLRLQRGRRDESNLSLEFISINSFRQSSFWASSTVAINFNHPF